MRRAVPRCASRIAAAHARSLPVALRHAAQGRRARRRWPLRRDVADGSVAFLGMEKAKDNELLQAAESGDVAAALAALDNGADLQCKDKVRCRSPAVCAARARRDAAYRRRLARCTQYRRADAATPSPPRRAQNRYLPLHLAAMHGHADVAALLVERGADVNAKGFVRHASRDRSRRCHARGRCVCTSSLAVVLTRLRRCRSASLCRGHAQEDWTPLQTAARNGHVAVAAFLLDHNADVNAKTSVRHVARHAAITLLTQSR